MDEFATPELQSFDLPGEPIETVPLGRDVLLWDTIGQEWAVGVALMVRGELRFYAGTAEGLAAGCEPGEFNEVSRWHELPPRVEE